MIPARGLQAHARGRVLGERRAGGLEVVLRGGAVPAQRGRGVRVLRQQRERPGEDARGVGRPRARRRLVFLGSGALAQAGRQRHQRACQVAAVHGRDVARRERHKRHYTNNLGGEFCTP